MTHHHIAIHGKSGAGKSTVAAMLCDHYLYEELALGYHVKVVAHQLGWNGEKDAAGRLLLQNIGAVGRAYNPGCFIEVVAKAMKERVKGQSQLSFVIPDVRYMNEYTSFKHGGFKLVKIVRPNNPAALQGAAAAHPSETELDSLPNSAWDAILVNDSTLEDLASHVQTMMNHFAT